MKIAIIDDEASSIAALSDALKKYDDTDIVGTASNGMRGISLMRETMPDVLFLDVELPDMSGLEFLEQQAHITQGRCHIVIYTAHSHYMLPAFRNEAFDFLLKPVDPTELQKVLQRCQIALNKSVSQASTTPQANGNGTKLGEKIILYTNMTDFRLVDMRDIGFFQYNHLLRVWEVILAGQQEPLRLKRTQNNESLVNLDARFIQVHQKYIININYLMEVHDNTCRFYPPFDQFDHVIVGRQYRKRFIEQFSML